MEEEKQATEKSQKSKLWIIGNIYFNIIGVNLLLLVIFNISQKIIGFRKSIIVGTFWLLLSVIASIFAIKWGVEKVLQKSTVHPVDFLKISLLVGIIPIIFDILLSGWVIYTNLAEFSKLAWYLIPRLLSEFITTFISGLSYGIITYYWFKKLSNRF